MLTIFAHLFFFSIVSLVKANSFQSKTIHTAPNSSVTIPLTFNSSLNINAVQLEIDLDGLAYTNITATNGWIVAVAPTLAGNTVSVPFGLIAAVATGTFTIGELVIQTGSSSGTITITGTLVSTPGAGDNPITPVGLVEVTVVEPT